MSDPAPQSASRTLDLPCRYYRVYTGFEVPCDDRNFGFVERRLLLPVSQTALVLVDVLATHYIDSWLERARTVTREKLVPVLTAARDAGMTVIHAPLPWVIERHHPEAMPPAAPPRPADPDPWPPPAFRGIY